MKKLIRTISATVYDTAKGPKAMQDVSEIRLDKTKISVSDSFDNSDEKEYWLSRTPQERIQHIERLRRINYGAGATRRLQRTLEIIECEWR